MFFVFVNDPDRPILTFHFESHHVTLWITKDLRMHKGGMRNVDKILNAVRYVVLETVDETNRRPAFFPVMRTTERLSNRRLLRQTDEDQTIDFPNLKLRRFATGPLGYGIALRRYLYDLPGLVIEPAVVHATELAVLDPAFAEANRAMKAAVAKSSDLIVLVSIEHEPLVEELSFIRLLLDVLTLGDDVPVVLKAHASPFQTGFDGKVGINLHLTGKTSRWLIGSKEFKDFFLVVGGRRKTAFNQANTSSANTGPASKENR
jgi:hypothetical protein